jgi:NADH-quinone oxidoreductase subunit J
MFLNNYFVFFFLLILLCSLFVIISTNPVQSVYFLILVFVFTSILFVILGADFLAVLILIVYVGAVAILFLFVVMMLNLRIFELYSTFNSYLPIGSVLGIFFFMEFIYVLNTDLNFTRSNNFFESGFFSN